MEVKIPKEVRQHNESIFFGLSARQFICAVLAVIVAVAVYILSSGVLGKETASWLCILAAAPIVVAGFFRYNGMSFEQLVWAVIKSQFLCAGERRFISENLYYSMLNRKINY